MTHGVENFKLNCRLTKKRTQRSSMGPDKLLFKKGSLELRSAHKDSIKNAFKRSVYKKKIELHSTRYFFIA